MSASTSANPTYPTAADALALLLVTPMRPFTDGDWDAFSGCESSNPSIGENGAYLVVLDGAVLTLIHNDDASDDAGSVYRLRRDLGR